jgi:PD-(D/E)XK nuclease superfamily
MPIDFRQRTFVDWVSRAASEQVYSAAFAWLLSDQSTLSLDERLDVVAKLTDDVTSQGRLIAVKTEWKDIDLLLTIDLPAGPLVVAIENKIKAAEGEGQLGDYDRHLQDFPRVKKIFLTLNGEQPRSGAAWRAISYSVFLDAIRAQRSAASGYVADLCSAMARLIAVAETASADGGELASRAFRDPGARDSEIVSYMEDLRLNMVVQRMWMSELFSALNVKDPWKWSIKETNGQALLDVKAALLNDVGYAIGIQLQNRALKLFCSPDPYPKVASQEQHRNVGEILERSRSLVGLTEGIQPTFSRLRGFRSFRIAELPPGRQLDQWVKIVKPHVQRLQSVFMSVRAPAN